MEWLGKDGLKTSSTFCRFCLSFLIEPWVYRWIAFRLFIIWTRPQLLRNGAQRRPFLYPYFRAVFWLRPPDLLGQRFPLKDGNLKSRDEQQSASASGALGPSAGSCWAALVTVKSAKNSEQAQFCWPSQTWHERSAGSCEQVQPFKIQVGSSRVTRCCSSWCNHFRVHWRTEEDDRMQAEKFLEFIFDQVQFPVVTIRLAPWDIRAVSGFADNSFKVFPRCVLKWMQVQSQREDEQVQLRLWTAQTLSDSELRSRSL